MVDQSIQRAHAIESSIESDDLLNGNDDLIGYSSIPIEDIPDSGSRNTHLFNLGKTLSWLSVGAQRLFYLKNLNKTNFAMIPS